MELTGAMLGVLFEKRVRLKCVVTQTMTEVDIMPVNLHLDFAELAVPMLVLGVVAERVISRTIRDALADGILNPVPVIKSLSAGVGCQFIHSGMDPKMLIEILA